MSSMTKAESADFERRIEDLVNEETQRATKQHGQFHSPHEGWAVIREEYMEASERMDGIKQDMDRLDNNVRHDMPLDIHKDNAGWILYSASRAIEELIQLAATAQRYIYACGHRCGEFAKLPDTHVTPLNEAVRIAFPGANET